MNIIRSKENKAVKSAKKLLQKKYRKDTYLIEGFHLFEEASRSGAEILETFVTEEFADKFPEATIVTQEVLNFITDSKTPQGLVAVVEMNNDLDYEKINLNKVLVLDGVQDPGNVGTLIRTADAGGFDAVFLSRDCADVYSPKVMRSMQGSNYHLPVYSVDLSELYKKLKELRITIIASTLSDESISYKEVEKKSGIALVLGNEGQGISQLTKNEADVLVHIDMPGQAESLNVAIAGGILIFNFI
ncbi:TrmH family RNA methyltransferase [Floricoccus penangensis]|uniref:TrmH family RNA methyltransferase n=1 Tax=Floricoccus penangensis TaxID=1859475 RepID=UPI00203CBFDF|nr:RNA methyltransferase [Floricoccus penangensis]URZ86839.1 RNA methyltransferase [Floricoccus penangensis]